MPRAAILIAWIACYGDMLRPTYIRTLYVPYAGSSASLTLGTRLSVQLHACSRCIARNGHVGQREILVTPLCEFKVKQGPWVLVSVLRITYQLHASSVPRQLKIKRSSLLLGQSIANAADYKRYSSNAET